LPTLSGVIETALYVDDLERARAFYADVLGLAALTSDLRFLAFDVGGRNVLLLFQRGATLETLHLPGGTIPPHDGSGPIHVAFSITAAELPAWEKQLAEYKVAIEGRTDWPRGGHSVYFRDPDGHLLELVTPGVWAIY
jgi:catechol 2,3-dioxygenase-like lactoylglutathione lyase family enzyme